MTYYHLVGADISFPGRVDELDIFGVDDRNNFSSLPLSYTPPPTLPVRAKNWMDGEERDLEAWRAPPGILLRTSGGSDFYITPDGMAIERINEDAVKQDLFPRLTNLDRSILLGPALILSVALRSIWSLHASAVIYKENVIVFLGESGHGKSTLAAYLSQGKDWRLVADDILPVQIGSNGVNVLPHFPQLKLPMDAQPGVDLPERLPLKYICVLTHAEAGQMPELQKLSTAQTVQSLLSHIAGTRLFDSSLLAKHLDFSAQVGKQTPAYRLIHPHRRDTLPLVKGFFEKICQP